jgi:transcriptional regulator with XRE-family HTH domain
MTQAEAARVAGMSRAALANIEVGRQNLSVHQLYPLAVALKLDSPAKLLPVRSLERPVGEAGLTISEPGLNDRQRSQVERFYMSVNPAKRPDGAA